MEQDSPHSNEQNKQQEESEEQIRSLASGLNVNLDWLKEHVGQVTRQAVQSNSETQQEIQCFRKAVLDKKGGRKMLICRSDDIVLAYDCHRSTQTFFVKHYETTEEQKHMTCVMRREPRCSKRYDNLLARLETHLCGIAELIRLLLG